MMTIGKLKILTTVCSLALVTGLSPALVPPAYGYDCLLDTNNDGDADSNIDTNGGADSNGHDSSLACGGAYTDGENSTAIGSASSTSGTAATTIGRESSAGNHSVTVGYSAGSSSWYAVSIGTFAGTTDYGIAIGADSNNDADSEGAMANYEAISIGLDSKAQNARSVALGTIADAWGVQSIALGSGANSFGDRSIAIGGDNQDVDTIGAQASGNKSIAIGADTLAGFDDSIVIGADANASETGQVVLKNADTFTIMGNGDVGFGTATPLGNLHINSGTDDTRLILSNTMAQWEIKNTIGKGRLAFRNAVTGVKPVKIGPNAISNLLKIGITAPDRIDIKGTLYTTGPQCSGGCDAVFDADYDLPSIEEHATQMFANKHLPQVGPTTPLAPVNLPEKMGDMLNELEKAHIYIAQMNAQYKQEKQAMQAEIAEIKQQVAALIAQ